MQIWHGLFARNPPIEDVVGISKKGATKSSQPVAGAPDNKNNVWRPLFPPRLLDEHAYDGEEDAQGRPHGYGIRSFPEKSTCDTHSQFHWLAPEDRGLAGCTYQGMWQACTSILFFVHLMGFLSS